MASLKEVQRDTKSARRRIMADNAAAKLEAGISEDRLGPGHLSNKSD